VLPDPHRLAHTALAAVYAATAVILLLEGGFAHALCASGAALIYGALSAFPSAPRHAVPRRRAGHRATQRAQGRRA
jgi:hypothetical protein